MPRRYATFTVLAKLDSTEYFYVRVYIVARFGKGNFIQQNASKFMLKVSTATGQNIVS